MEWEEPKLIDLNKVKVAEGACGTGTSAGSCVDGSIAATGCSTGTGFVT